MTEKVQSSVVLWYDIILNLGRTILQMTHLSKNYDFGVIRGKKRETKRDETIQMEKVRYSILNCPVTGE